jgi:hypothetical protein
MNVSSTLNEAKDETTAIKDNAKAMRKLLREMADFVALYETLEEKLQEREKALEEKLIASEIRLNQQLVNIKNSLKDFEAIMTEAGAARWRLTAEKALKEGRTYMQALHTTSDEVTSTLKQGCEHLEHIASQTMAGVTKATNALPVEDFKRIAMEGSQQIKNATQSAVKNIAQLTQWFHWKNLTMAFAMTIFIIFITNLYVNDEWPWETHSFVAKERKAGHALLSAWPHLTANQQQKIIAYADKSIVRK